METVIYHNPRCSKSRGTLELLRENGVEPTIIEYLKSPPDAAGLIDLLGKLGEPVTSLVRFKESQAREMGLSDSDDRSEQQWCELLADNPILLERPIVVRGERAVIGRPPENVIGLIS